MTTNSNDVLELSPESNKSTDKRITKKDLKALFWRSFPLNIMWSFDRQMNVGFCYDMIPVIERLYDKPEDRIEAYKRHLEFYNIQVTFNPLVAGIVASMEEENANNQDFDTASINAMKASLMAPLSGIGDSLIASTLRMIATGVVTGLCLSGSLLGPILFLLLYNVPTILIRWFGLQYGYSLGSGMISKLNDSDVMHKVTSGLAIVGLMVVGGMVATTVAVTTPLALNFGDTAFKLQETLDGIFPALLPLCAFGIMCLCNKKQVKIIWQIVGILAAGIVLGVLGILG